MKGEGAGAGAREGEGLGESMGERERADPLGSRADRCMHVR